MNLNKINMKKFFVIRIKSLKNKFIQIWNYFLNGFFDLASIFFKPSITLILCFAAISLVAETSFENFFSLGLMTSSFISLSLLIACWSILLISGRILVSL